MRSVASLGRAFRRLGRRRGRPDAPEACGCGFPPGWRAAEAIFWAGSDPHNFLKRRLDKAPRTPNPYFRSLGQGAYEIALHEMYHVGLVAALRRAWKKPSMG